MLHDPCDVALQTDIATSTGCLRVVIVYGSTIG